MMIAVISGSSIDVGGVAVPVSSLVAVVSTDGGNVLVFQDGSTALSQGSIYDIADMCPWVRCAV